MDVGALVIPLVVIFLMWQWNTKMTYQQRRGLGCFMTLSLWAVCGALLVVIPDVPPPIRVVGGIMSIFGASVILYVFCSANKEKRKSVG